MANYFSTVFKSRYEFTPSEFKKEQYQPGLIIVKKTELEIAKTRPFPFMFLA